MSGPVPAVVLARGLGRRMREGADGPGLSRAQSIAADAGHKALVPMGERTFLDYVLSGLADAGFAHAILVVAPEHQQVRDHVKEPWGFSPGVRLSVDFAVQPEPKGTADAVLAVEPLVRGSEFVVINSDNLYPTAALCGLASHHGPALPVFERDDLIQTSGIPANRVGAFALLEVDADGWLRRIIEKPGADAVEQAGPGALVSMNCWRFDERIFDACRHVERSSRGEFELPMAVALALERGVPFRALPARGPVLDLSRRSDIPDVARRLAEIEVRL